MNSAYPIAMRAQSGSSRDLLLDVQRAGLADGNHLSHEETKTAESKQVHSEVHEVNQREFPIRVGSDDSKAQSYEPGIEWAPVSIDGCGPVSAKVSFSDVDVRHGVSIHQVVMIGPGVSKAQYDRQQPERDLDPS